MFNVELYNFSKRENSTKQPNRQDATVFQCTIKDGCGMLNPQIVLDIGLSSAPLFNYAYIPEFDRYYWVEEWTNIHPMWSASLNVDVLASYRVEIGDADLYCLRSANNYDGTIIDVMYPTKVVNEQEITYSNPTQLLPSPSIADGMFVIGVVSTSANFGSIQYYALKHSSFASLVTQLLSDATLTNFGFNLQQYDASLALQKALIDPLSYIKSCIFVPYAYNDLNVQEVNTLNIWDWSLSGVPNKPITYDNFAVALPTCVITLPKHPQTSSRGDYCNVAPYTNMHLIITPFGEIDIDTTLLYDQASISLVGRLDLTTGESYVNIINADGFNLSRLFAQIGVPITLSQVTTDKLTQTFNSINSASNFFSNAMHGNVGGAIASISSGIENGIRATLPRQYSTGEQGGFMKLYLQPILLTTFYELVDDDIQSHGRPCCKVLKPKNVNGYMLIQDADISLNSTSFENQKVRQYLESGFYYE